MTKPDQPFDFDPAFVDFDRYMRGIYTPPPALVALATTDPFWSTFGGDGNGFGGEVERQRAAAITRGAVTPDSYT